MPTSTVRAWRRVPLITALLLAAGVAVMLGVLGRVRGPAGDQLPTFGFSDTVTFKAWTATVVLVLATVQLLTALGMYRHLPRLHHMPQWLHAAHRATGIAALVLSLPVAGYCLYSFGFAPAPLSPRTLIHSIAGCTFYGAFAGKILLVHTRRLPRWALPIAGGALLTAVVLAWLTSALWLFTTTGLHT
jgi:hypothetical protein